MRLGKSTWPAKPGCSAATNFCVAWTYKIHEEADRHLDNLGPAARAEITAWLEKRIHGASVRRHSANRCAAPGMACGAAGCGTTA
jgi:hypothetical protein